MSIREIVRYVGIAVNRVETPVPCRAASNPDAPFRTDRAE